MSKSVVPATTNASAQEAAKAPENNGNPAAEAKHARPADDQPKVAKDQPKPSSDEQDVVDAELEAGVVVDDEAASQQASTETETSLAEGFSFDGALAAAAESAGSLISEAEAADGVGFSMSNDDGSSGGTILLIGAVALVGLGIYALASGGGSSNDAPTYDGPITASGNEDTAIAVDATADDADGDVLTYTAGTSANGTIVNNNNGTFTFTPNANFNGTATFTVTATDPDGESATTTVTVTVNPVNDAPRFVDGTGADITTITATTAEDTALTGSLNVVDPDANATQTYSVTVAPTNGTVTVDADGDYTYTPNANYNGPDSYVVQVSDGTATDTLTVSVNVTAVNDAPVAGVDNDTTLTVAEDGSVEFDIDFDDVEGDLPLTVSVSTAPQNGTIVSTGTSQSYVPDANFNGTDSFQVTVTDSEGAATTYTVNVTVTPVNDDPTVNLAQSTVDVTIDEDSAGGSFNVVGFDVDGDDLTYEVSDPANGSITAFNVETGVGTYVPGANFNGTETFTVTITDGNGGEVTQDVTFTVTPQPEAATIDITGPNANTPATVAVGSDDFILSDDAHEDSDVLITGFGLGDVIEVSNSTLGSGTPTQSEYNFGTGTDPDDLLITFVDSAAGSDNIILIDDVLAGSNLSVFDYDSAVAAVAESLGDSSYVFMTFA